MKKLQPQLSTFQIIYFMVLGVAFLFVIFYDKLLFHLLINAQHNQKLDFFFKYFTHFGDGLFVILFLFALGFFIKLRYSLIGIIAFLISGICCQLIKNIFAKDLRPASFFNPNVLHFVDGVKINYMNSFPSGHTATAFAFFIFLSFVDNRKINHFFYAIAACLVAYSRIYLSQHFLIDVVYGSILGTASFFIAYKLVNKMNYKLLEMQFEVRLFSKIKSKKSVATSLQTN